MVAEAARIAWSVDFRFNKILFVHTARQLIVQQY